ncbi:MAG: hypothetical protein ACYCWW_15160 [Deltaproteobacteria bacterium]
MRTSLTIVCSAALALASGIGCCPERLVAVPTGQLSPGEGQGSTRDDGGLELTHEDGGEKPDAGVEADGGRDAGEREDAGPADAGQAAPDAGPPDAGPPNVAPPDAGPPDAGPTCAPSPDLTGDWSMTADYDLSQVVQNSSLLTAFNDIDNFLNTLATLGAPVPQWALTLFGDLASISSLYQDIHVLSDLTLAAAPPAGPDSQYQAQETWNSVEVMQNGSWVPLQSGASGFQSPPGYAIQVCGTDATFDLHDLSAALGGLVPPLLDAVTNVATCSGSGPCYTSFDSAIQGALDCSQYTGSALLFCQGSSAALLAELQNALNQITVSFGAAKVAGTAQIPDALDVTNGVWAGTAFGATFPGTFSATKN